MRDRRYTCVIFDIDGTLIDTENAVISSLQKLLKLEKNKEYTREELTFCLGIPGQETLKILNFTDIAGAFISWNQYLHEASGSSSVFPEIEDALKELISDQYILGIVTSKTKEELVTQFNPFGLQQYFNFTVCADDTRKHKPHPDPLLKFLDITGLAPAQTLYVGDTIYDAQCAEASGVDFALALWGTKNADIKADFKPVRPCELLKLIRG